MKAIVFRLSQGSDKQFEIGENADKNVIGYFAEEAFLSIPSDF